MKILFKFIYLLIWLQTFFVNFHQIDMGPVLPAAMVPISDGGLISTDLAIGNISRFNDGDTFLATGGDNCGPDTCVGLSSGTAGEKFGQTCTCQCLNHLPAFRDDLHICVDDIHECPLAPFVSGSVSQMIPFVFLPLKGQIVHPSKEISFAGVQKPLCAVSGAQFLTRSGWVDLRNPIDADVPFRLFRDEGRTFLQWLGDTHIRQRMAGRLILVHMLCRDITFNHQPPEMQTVFTPCVAFRVVGTPIKHQSNVSEVVFSPDAQSAVYTSTIGGLNSTEYIAIGICSILLGLIYVSSVFLYLHLRKRKEAKNVQKTTSKSTSGDGGIQNDKSSNSNDKDQNSNDDSNPNIKNNPLIGLSARHFQNSFNSADTGRADSDDGQTSGDCMSDTDGGLPDVLQNHHERTNGSVNQLGCTDNEDIFWRNRHQLTSALIHQTRTQQHDTNRNTAFLMMNDSLQESSNIERHPEENVSIVETIEGRPGEDRPDTVKAIVNNNARRKLYFNPAYFEPHLLMAPPPAAIEFLSKIREVITIAKQKMASKRFTPSLMGIPEEDGSSQSNKDPIYECIPNNSARRTGSIISLKRENSRRKQTAAAQCANCSSNEPPIRGKLTDLQTLPQCKSCTVAVHENKKRSIHKWLEDVPVLKSPATSVRSEDPRILSSYINERLKASFDKICLPERSPSFYSENKHHKKPKLLLNQSILSRNRKIPAPIIPKQNLPPHPHPDMINEAIVVDQIPRKFKKSSTIEPKEKMAAVINEFAVLVKPHVSPKHSKGKAPKAPTTINQTTTTMTAGGELSSPEYETDSLERTQKRNTGFHTPTDYGDVSSSQPSPSLSNALPLDEEMTMRNAIFSEDLIVNNNNNNNNNNHHHHHHEHEHEYEFIENRKNNLYKLPELLQNRDDCYSLVSEVYVNNGYNYDSEPTSLSGSASEISEECSTQSTQSLAHNHPPKVQVHYTEPEKPGHLLIEVEDCVNNYIRVEDSDQFEPDTLDRKPTTKTHDEISPLTQTSRITNTVANKDFDSLERSPSQQILLRTTGSFKNDSETSYFQTDPIKNYFNRNFGSLREIYEAKTKIRSTSTVVDSVAGPNSLGSSELSWKCDDFEEDEGRLLTLEERHARRQRKSTPPNTIMKTAPPDVIPPTSMSSIYEHPKPPRKVFEDDDLITKPPMLPPKNAIGRGTKKLMDIEHNETTTATSPSPSVSLPSTLSSTSVKSQMSSEQVENTLLLLCTHSGYGQQQTLIENLCTKAATPATKLLTTTNQIKTKNEFQRKLETDALLNDMIKDSGTEIQTHFCSKNNTNNHLKNKWRKFVALKSPRPEDSGYLSTDSNDNDNNNHRIKKFQKDILEEKNEDGSLSDETDESLGDGHSESGAESMETHSVFFDSFRKKRDCDNAAVDPPAASTITADNTLIGSFDSGVSCKWIKSHDIVTAGFINHFNFNNPEQQSFVTVLPLTNSKHSH